MTPRDDSVRSKPCPICTTPLEPIGRIYSVEELFALWKPVSFAAETIAEHARQSTCTRLHRCSHCRIEVFLPQIIARPRFYIEAYDLEGRQASGGLSYSDAKWDFEEAGKDMLPHFSVLEIGCGPGNFLDTVSGKVASAVGAEFNSSALQIARQKGHRVFDGESLPEELRHSFDAVASFHVLEHVLDPLAFLEEIGTWARPGGLVCISLPNQAGPIRLIDPCIQNMPPHHATRWQLRTFEIAARRLGWVIERVAFEPLTRDNAYYYSTYLGPYLFPRQGWMHRYARLACEAGTSVLLGMMFGALSSLGRVSTPLLKGQAIYVAMRIPSGERKPPQRRCRFYGEAGAGPSA